MTRETRQAIAAIENSQDLHEIFKEEAEMTLEVSNTKMEAARILAEIIRDYFLDNDVLSGKIDYSEVNWKQVAEKQL